METIDFSTFKEKIIKINELFNLVVEKEQSLEKSQKWGQLLKTRLELSKNEITKLRLKNETLTNDLNATKASFANLTNDYENLNKEFSRLEVDSNQTINSLQVNYQLANQQVEELESRLVELQKPQNSPKKGRRKSPVKKRVDENNSELLAMKIVELQLEKEKFFDERGDLQLEVFQLKKRIAELDSFEKNCKCVKTNEELNKMKNEYKTVVTTKDKEIQKLISQIKQIENEKERLKIKMEKSEDEFASFRIEAALKSKKLATDKTESEVLKTTEMLEDLRKLNSTPSDEEVSSIFKNMIVSSRISPLEDNIKKVQTNYNYKELFDKKQKMAKLRRYRKQVKQVDLHAALLALKKANIDFIISSNSLLPTSFSNNARIKPYMKFKKRSKQIFSQELCCTMSSCQNSYMSLKKYDDDDDSAELLGFVGVKNEEIPMEIDSLMLKLPEAPSRQLTEISGSLARQSSERKSNFKRPVCSSRQSSRLTATSPKIHNFDSPSGKPISVCRQPIGTIKENDSMKAPSSILPCNKKLKESVCSTRRSLRLTPPKENNSLTAPPATENDYPKAPPTKPISPCKRAVCTTEANGSLDAPSSIFSCNNKFKDSICLTRRSLRLTLAEENTSSGPSPCVENDNPKLLSTKPSSPGKRPICTTEESDCLDGQSSEPACRNKFKRPVCSTRRSPRLILPDANVSSAVPASMENDSPTVESGVNYNLEARSNELILPCTTKFKRPVCLTRRSSNLTLRKDTDSLTTPSNIDGESPKSPSVETPSNDEPPIVIPLEPIFRSVEKMPISKIEQLLNKLILYSNEEEAMNEVVREFSTQSPHYISEAVLERVAVDSHESADTKYAPAPLMTDVQRVLMGFMSRLEKSSVSGVFDSFLVLAEQRLLTNCKLDELVPITRLYLAVCKQKKDIIRMRKLCCDIFYFCVEFAVPFLFVVLTSWTRVLPHERDSKEFPLARVMVQLVHTKGCSTPGYNLNPLKDLLIKFYGYPNERWDSDTLFNELFENYLKNPSRTTDFPLILLCKHSPEQWVYDKIEEFFHPIVAKPIQNNFKATLIILIGNLYNRFSSKSEVNFLPKIREWFMGLINEDTPEVVKRCIYASLHRLRNK